MKKILSYIAALAVLIASTGCDALNLEPVSSITDANYWKNDTHFSAYSNGIYSQFRTRGFNFYALGELRGDMYRDQPFGGEASQGWEMLPLNSINAQSVGISNYANLYPVINSANLLIAKTEASTSLSDTEKSIYLGEAYGLRAYMYFHLLRSWGNVILHTDFTSGQTLDLANLEKAASGETEVMAQIKSDIEASEKAYGSAMNFAKGRNRWSPVATKMLKGEVYLWSGARLNGGTADYQTAKTALEAVKNADVALLPDFFSVFAFGNKCNKEIIFAIHNEKDEASLWGGTYSSLFVPQKGYFGNYCNADGVAFSQTAESQLSGIIRLGITKEVYSQGFREGDSRIHSLIGVYQKDAATGNINYVSCIGNKYRGTMVDGSDVRNWLDDQPIYRYSDCLLTLAFVKAMMGEDPSGEINEVRERAYGKEYFQAHRNELAYPNDNGDFYSGNIFAKADNAGAIDAVLKERFREFMFEGKRWYDLRTAGLKYVQAHSYADANRLLWPIDANTLTNNRALKQTPGY